MSMRNPPPLRPIGDELHCIFQVRGNAEVAGEMVERAERQDPKRSLRPDERGSRGADRSVPTADNEQRIAAFGDSLGTDIAISAVDQLDLGVDASMLERLDHLGARLWIARHSPASAVQ